MDTNIWQDYKPIRILRYPCPEFITKVSCNQHAYGIMKLLVY